eukprot:gene11749-15721_t
MWVRILIAIITIYAVYFPVNGNNDIILESYGLEYFKFVRGNVIDTQKNMPELCYIILEYSKVVRYVKECKILESLFGISNVEQLPIITSEELAKYELGEPLPGYQMIYSHEENLDLALARSFNQIESLSEPLIYNISQICDQCKNPSIMYWQDRVLMCTEFHWHPSSLIFAWINVSGFPFINDHYLGISNGAKEIDGTIMHGIDCRMLPTSKESFTVSYGNPDVSPMRVSIGHININSENQLAKFSHLYRSITPDPLNDPSEFHSKQKNWVPFNYKNSVYYLVRINPMHVVNILDHTQVNDLNSDVISTLSISKTLARDIPWKFGELRGGSNAVLVNNTYYLAFFHSIHTLPLFNTKTYYIGAYTFSAEPPFSMLSISPFPVYDPFIYSGKWINVRNTVANYVPYPTGIILKDDILTLSFGKNDESGFVGRIKLGKLLKNMVPVNNHN